ncbi:unnamed protein product [Durusdinium trenchii]|uniref:Glycosyltransferase family 92 protein n=2 Tax=Durusdinium trenchii TaxID=1381693 RepID=A0ABP0NS39_9DINO
MSTLSLHGPFFALLCLVTVDCGDGKRHVAETENEALIQVSRFVSNASQSWRSTQDLASVSLSQRMEVYTDEIDFELQFLSAVPVFTDQDNYIALIHNNTAALQKYVQNHSFFCTGPNGSHRTQLRLSASLRAELSIFACDWPKEDGMTGEYDVFLELPNGEIIGQVHANYKPSLLKQYGTMACVRNLWNDPGANVSGLESFPQWLDYHRMHGVHHFIIYTTSDMSPALQEMYQPYIDEGVVTRVHLDVPAERCWCYTCVQQLLILNDCLYRAKGHARWLLPSLDVDEYLRVNLPAEDVTRLMDGRSEGRRPVASIFFKKFRFARAPPGSLDISSPRYSNIPEDNAYKYAANVSLVNVVSVHHHQPVKGLGKILYESPTVAAVNHYRHPHLIETQTFAFANSSDNSLLAKVPLLEASLEKRYGAGWKGFLERMRAAPELTNWSCSAYSLSANGPPVWENE